MTITDQIIEAADANYRFATSSIQKKASNLIKADQATFYTKKYQEYSEIINESKYSATLPLKHITKYNQYEEIMEAIYNDFYPLSPRKPIDFRDIENNTPAMGANKTPVVKKYFDFSRDTEKGQEITTYLTNLFILRWLKAKMGYDTNRYPNKEYLVVFEHENTIYIWKREITSNPRLYIDENRNEEILEVYHNIYFSLGFGIGKLTPLLENLPYLEGDEAQKEFDINWYKAKKQSPLTYRCFSNTFTVIVRPDPNPDLCKHAGEYCIEKEEMEERFDRFLNVYNAIDKDEQQTLITNSIDYFEKFLKTDCFEKTIHKQQFEEILYSLRQMQESISNDEQISDSRIEETEQQENDYFESILSFMAEKNSIKGGVILNGKDYKRLVEYTKILIEENKVPETIHPIPKTSLTNQQIIYTYSLIHDNYISGTEIEKEYIVFLHKVFFQFKNSDVEFGDNYRKTTAYKKFREEPPDYKRLINW